MSSSLAQVTAIYGSKLKKKQRGRLRARPKLAISNSELKVELSPDRRAASTKAGTTHTKSQVFHSVEPRIRNYLDEYRPSATELNRRKNSLENDLEKLEKLQLKNVSARQGLLNVQQRMMELGIKDLISSGKLATIREDEVLYFEDLERPRGNPIEALVQKYEHRLIV